MRICVLYGFSEKERLERDLRRGTGARCDVSGAGRVQWRMPVSLSPGRPEMACAAPFDPPASPPPQTCQPKHPLHREHAQSEPFRLITSTPALFMCKQERGRNRRPGSPVWRVGVVCGERARSTDGVRLVLKAWACPGLSEVKERRTRLGFGHQDTGQ